jgi:hypothetical protein
MFRASTSDDDLPHGPVDRSIHCPMRRPNLPPNLRPAWESVTDYDNSDAGRDLVDRWRKPVSTGYLEIPLARSMDLESRPLASAPTLLLPTALCALVSVFVPKFEIVQTEILHTLAPALWERAYPFPTCIVPDTLWLGAPEF